jgi:hypothetical protein
MTHGDESTRPAGRPHTAVIHIVDERDIATQLEDALASEGWD